MMSGRMRAKGRRAGALLLTLITLSVQSVLPVLAVTVDSEQETASDGYTIVEESGSQSLEYFDRIAVSSLHGDLTIRSGEDFAISFSEWNEAPDYYVQDDILVVTGKRMNSGQDASASDDTSDDASSGSGGDGGGDVVILGEDEPGNAGSGSGGAGDSADAEKTAATGSADSADAGETDGNGDTEGTGGTEEASAEEAEGSDAGSESENSASQSTVITVPAGVGLDTLRVAIVDGTLVITDITATDVTIQSAGGDVILKDVSFGTVDVYSSDGDVQLVNGSFNSMSIGVGTGNVSVQSDEGLARCRMELRTENGTITVNGAVKGSQYLQPGNGKRTLNIQDEDGDITVAG